MVNIVNALIITHNKFLEAYKACKKIEVPENISLRLKEMKENFPMYKIITPAVEEETKKNVVTNKLE